MTFALSGASISRHGCSPMIVPREPLERVFAEMEQQRPDAVLVSGEGDLYANRVLIAELAPSSSPSPIVLVTMLYFSLLTI
jgi:hypothetical protein